MSKNTRSDFLCVALTSGNACQGFQLAPLATEKLALCQGALGYEDRKIKVVQLVNLNILVNLNELIQTGKLVKHGKRVNLHKLSNLDNPI